MIGKNIGAAAAAPAARSDAHAILRSFSKSVMQTSCGQFMQFVGPRMPPLHRRGATMLANKPPGII